MHESGSKKKKTNSFFIDTKTDSGARNNIDRKLPRRMTQMLVMMMVMIMLVIMMVIMTM